VDENGMFNVQPAKQEGFLSSSTFLKPRGRGAIGLRSASPDAPPRICYQFLADPGRVLGDYLRAETALDPDRNFVQCASDWLTLRVLDRRSDRVAADLQAIGVTKGTRVAVSLPNRIEFVVLIYAIAKAGAIQVPLNTFLRGDFLRHQLEQTGPGVYITDEAGLRILAPLLPELPEQPELVLVGGGSGGAGLPAALDYAELEAAAGGLAAVTIEPADICAIVFTSGTTGPSKGCTITHGYYCNLINVFIDLGWYEQGDIIFGANPLFHFSGQTWLVAAALAMWSS
jgi:crotonobetaine/carnitine-CoA ligase